MPLRVKNIAAGYYDSTGFHPIRASQDYDPGRIGEAEKYKTAKGKKGAKGKAKRAAEVARTSRAARATLKRASGRRKRGEAALEAAKAAKKAAKRKKNPIPTNRYVTAKIKRTRSGDLKVILPLR
jgi:hypothetical protein